MAYLCLTLIDPRPGFEQEAQKLLKELDADLASSDGLIMSLVLKDRSNRLGRLSLWDSRHEADQNAGDLHVMAVRSRLHNLSASAEEGLMEVESGHRAEGLRRTLGETHFQLLPR